MTTANPNGRVFWVREVPGRALRSLVPGSGQGYGERKLLRVVGCVHVCLRTNERRTQWLPRVQVSPVAEKGYRGILKEFVKTDANGRLNLEGTVSVAVLGGNPYRDGSYEYYLSEKVVTNDPKGIGTLILAATEIETVAKWRKKGKLSTSHK